MSSSYRNTLNDFLKTLDIDCHKLIDIGGSQEGLSKRVNSFKVEKFLIADLESPHKDSPQPDFVLDLNDPMAKEAPTEYFETHMTYASEENKADMITVFEVFDYVWNPSVAFDNIAYLLKSGGIAWVSFPTVYPLHQPVEDDALRYMKGGIVKLAKYAGLKIEEMIPRRPETNKWQEFFYAERMRGARGEDHSLTGWIVKF